MRLAQRRLCGCVGGPAPHSFTRTGNSGMRGWVEEGVGWRRPGDLGEGALQGSPGTWVQHGKGHSSIRKLLTQRADDLSLIRNAQANVFHAKHLMASALGPGHFHRVASEGKGFSSTPCSLVVHGHGSVSCPSVCGRNRSSCPSALPRAASGLTPLPCPSHGSPSDTLSLALQLRAGNQERASIDAENPF